MSQSRKDGKFAKKQEPDLLDKLLEKLENYEIIVHKDTTQYDRWTVTIEKRN